MIERRHQHFSKYLSGGTHHVCKRPTLDVRTSPTLDVLCGRRAIMIETQKNCKARNSNKSTKESVKPEVAFQVSDSKLETRDARDTSETHASGGDPKDHKTQNKSLRKTGAKQHSSAETGTSESEQDNKKGSPPVRFCQKLCRNNHIPSKVRCSTPPDDLHHWAQDHWAQMGGPSAFE